jgi:hypothetical protein
MRHNKSSLRGQGFQLPNEQANERPMLLYITLIQTGYFDAFAAAAAATLLTK